MVTSDSQGHVIEFRSRATRKTMNLNREDYFILFSNEP